MKADVKTILELTEQTVRYEVPRYQRPYVWNEDDHWEPLWNDILTLIDRYRAGTRADHFLGAVVLKGETPIPGKPNVFEVIDGQQRMTTVQLVLMAAVNVSRELQAERTASLLEELVRNDERKAEGNDRYKVWPTESDRAAFKLVATPGGPDPNAEDDPNNMIQEGYAFFYHALTEFAEEGMSSEQGSAGQLEDFRIVFSELFKFVAIALEGDDEAQVIFETLNARGTPLLAMDLVKNATFRVAEQQDAPVAELHDEVWDPEFGNPYWREEIKQGRLTRPRAEIFLMHWMTMKLGSAGELTETIRADRVFKTFQSHFLVPGRLAEPLVRELARDAAVLRSFDNIPPSSREGRFFRTTDYLEQSTFLPVVLWLYTQSDLSQDSRIASLDHIESFLMRRSLMGYFTKSYNRLALRMLTRIGRRTRTVDEEIAAFLSNSGEPSSNWPSDEKLRDRLLNKAMYGWFKRSRLVGMLSEIELHFRDSAKTEDVWLLDQSLQVEHILPRSWQDHWPLESPSPEAAEEREEAANLLGNLTLVTGSLNATLSNQAWPDKRDRYLHHSLLLLNRRIASGERWNEEAINSRGRELADVILGLWPGPVDDSETAEDPEVGELSQNQTKSMPTRELNERQKLRHSFFEGLLEVARERTSLHAATSPSGDDTVWCGAGTSGVHWTYRIRPGEVRVILAMESSNEQLNRQRFDSILAHRQDVEQAFGDQLKWDAVDGRKRCQILTTITTGGYDSPPALWPAIFEDSAASMARLEEALRDHVARFAHNPQGRS